MMKTLLEVKKPTTLALTREGLYYTYFTCYEMFSDETGSKYLKKGNRWFIGS